VLKRLLRIPQEEVTFARRHFRVPRESVRKRLEQVGTTFLGGYHAALAEEGMPALEAQLSAVEPEFRGFAYEGAAMALDLLDQLPPWRRPRLPEFLDGIGARHVYMVHVGIGWSMARLPLRRERRLLRLDSLLRWLALDGYGFHEGYFHWPRYADGTSRPKRLNGYGLRAFDQGLGRSLWFVGGADPQWIVQAVSAFPESRHRDLWSGIGLACAYAGGADSQEINRLRLAANDHYPHLAQGAVFAAGARNRAVNPAGHTELACQLLCDLSAQEAAALSDETRRHAQEDSEPAYEVWRRLIRMHFTGQERQLREPQSDYRGLSMTTSNSGEETENVQRS
jgi:enediyne biosynthesis protein E3